MPLLASLLWHDMRTFFPENRDFFPPEPVELDLWGVVGGGKSQINKRSVVHILLLLLAVFRWLSLRWKSLSQVWFSWVFATTTISRRLRGAPKINILLFCYCKLYIYRCWWSFGKRKSKIEKYVYCALDRDESENGEENFAIMNFKQRDGGEIVCGFFPGGGGKTIDMFSVIFRHFPSCVRATDVGGGVVLIPQGWQ